MKRWISNSTHIKKTYFFNDAGAIANDRFKQF